MTAKGSPIGHVNPSLLSPNDWKVLPVSYTATPPKAQTVAPKAAPPSRR